MIVKLIIHKEMDAISIWNEGGDRLFYSDLAVDIKTAKELLTVQKAKTDAELVQEKIEGKIISPIFEQRMFGYFNAYWKKKIVQLTKRAAGYTW